MSETRIEDFLRMQNLEDDLLGHIEKIVRVHRFDRKKAQEAKAYIRRSVQIMTREGDRTKVIDEQGIAKAINWIMDIGRRGREKVYLEISPDLGGIREIITGDEIRFKETGS